MTSDEIVDYACVKSRVYLLYIKSDLQLQGNINNYATYSLSTCRTLKMRDLEGRIVDARRLKFNFPIPEEVHLSLDDILSIINNCTRSKEVVHLYFKCGMVDVVFKSGYLSPTGDARRKLLLDGDIQPSSINILCHSSIWFHDETLFLGG